MSQYIVIGLGYVGINLFNSLQKKYSKVIGYDIDGEKINQLNSGIDPSNEIRNFKLVNKSLCTDDLDNQINLNLKTIFFICVPTPLKGSKPDLSIFEKAILKISKFKLHNPFIIVNESSVYPGQTESITYKVFSKKKMTRNVNYSLSFSPERINPGDNKNNFNNINKIVASDNTVTLNEITKIYKSITKGKIIKSKSIFEAEASKLIENTQRDINIAFMNEMEAIFKSSYGNINNILSLANTKWNFCNFKPGYVGGHCIAVDPYYLIEYAKKNNRDFSFIKKAREINDDKIKSVNRQILNYVNLKKKKFYNILIVGITYKPNVPDLRESQSIKLYKLLDKKNHFKIFFYDTLISNYNGINSINVNTKKKFDIIINMSIHDNMKKNLVSIKKLLFKDHLTI